MLYVVFIFVKRHKQRKGVSKKLDNKKKTKQTLIYLN